MVGRKLLPNYERREYEAIVVAPRLYPYHFNRAL